MKTEWRIVPGYTRYLVSNKGKVRHYLSTQKRKLFKNPRGYLIVTVWDDKLKQQKGRMVHRLVSLAFIPNPENKPFVDHIDFDKQNNRVNNLRWLTQKENIHHSIAGGRYKEIWGKDHVREDTSWAQGEENSNSKLTIEQVLKIRKSELTKKKLAKKYNIGYDLICKIIGRRSWIHV